MQAPNDADPGLVTRLLAECAKGHADAFDRLIPLVYDDLRGIAHSRLRHEQAGHTLNTTALVHEAWMRMVDHATTDWRDRAHFFALSSTVIRRILVDHARRRSAEKRGGDQMRIPLREDLEGDSPDLVELLTLDEALEALGRRDPRLVRIVECRFFGGMTMKDTALALDLPLRTAERDWARAKAYLYDALRGD